MLLNRIISTRISLHVVGDEKFATAMQSIECIAVAQFSSPTTWREIRVWFGLELPSGNPYGCAVRLLINTNEYYRNISQLVSVSMDNSFHCKRRKKDMSYKSVKMLKKMLKDSKLPRACLLYLLRIKLHRCEDLNCLIMDCLAKYDKTRLAVVVLLYCMWN